MPLVNAGIFWPGNVCCFPTFGCRLEWIEGGTAMPRENYVAKQQRIGERLTRAMAKAHMDRKELAELTGYRARPHAAVPDRADKAVPCT